MFLQINKFNLSITYLRGALGMKAHARNFIAMTVHVKEKLSRRGAVHTNAICCAD
jgi:hypothetical protein